MKTTKLFFMAALVLMTAACSNDDNDLLVPAQPVQSSEGIPFSATISVSNGSAVTRALSDTGEKIEATWAVGEKVALLHNDVRDEMTVSNVSGGVATITGTITGSPTDGEDVTVIYPAAVASIYGVPAGLLDRQDGTLTGTNGQSIAEVRDLRSGKGTLKVSGTEASLDGNVSLENWYCISKFTLQDSGGSPISATKFLINDGYQSYTVTPDVPTSEFYVAMWPMTDGTFDFFATDGTNDYTKYGISATVDKGKYYKSTLKLTSSSYRDGNLLTYREKEAIIATLSVPEVGIRRYAIATTNETDLTGISAQTNTKTIDGVTYYTFANACAKFAGGKTDGSYTDADVWRLPTQTELTALTNHPNYWQGSPAGRCWTIGSNSLLLPAAGYCYSGNAKEVGNKGYYWSSTPCNDNDDAYFLLFASDNCYARYFNSRLEGRTVRLFCQLPIE